MLIEINNTHQSAGLSKVCDFAIETNGVMIKALTSRLYSNPIASIVRELASNALDACRTQPMVVSIPTPLDPAFRIRDFGQGLAPTQMAEVFTRFGASTKRSDNSQIGGFGLGAKSPFALVNSYTIISYHGGHKTTYVASITGNGMPALHEVQRIPSGETGLEIVVPAAPSPQWVEALSQIQFFEPRPIIKGCTFDYLDPLHETPEYLVMPSGEAKVLVGPVAYPLAKDRLTSNTIPPIVLKLGIGSIEVTASREEIVYSAPTVATLKAHLDRAVTDYRSVVNTLLSGCTNVYDMWRILEGAVLYPEWNYHKDGHTYTVHQRSVSIPANGYRIVARSSRRKTWRFSSPHSSRLTYYKEDVIYLEDDTRKLQERITNHYHTLPNVTSGTDIYLVKDRTHFDNLGIPVYPVSSLPYSGTLRNSPKPRTFRIVSPKDKLVPDPGPFTGYLKVSENLEWRGKILNGERYNLMSARVGKFCVVTPSFRGSLDGMQDIAPIYDDKVQEFWTTAAPRLKDWFTFASEINWYLRPLYAACADVGLLPPVPADLSKEPHHHRNWHDISLFCPNLPHLPLSINYEKEFKNVLQTHPLIRTLFACTSWTSHDIPAITDIVRALIKE